MKVQFATVLFLGKIILILVEYTRAERPIVQTRLGTVRGVEASDGDYNMYMSVPYGKVNLSNPFGAAVPIKKYDGVIEADKDTLSCIHMNKMYNSIVGKLDCLELNIYTPKIANDTNPVPVLVYLYGGNLMTGTANRSYYGPKFLVRYDVVLITVEFRSGPYGFMCLDTPEVPGNQGLKDQLLALQWIQENIKAFGGDPNKVTLSGQSSGSILAHFHYIFGPDKLFHRVIFASGVAYNEKFMKESNKTIPFLIAEAAGLKTKEFDEAFNFLKNMDPKLLLRINHELGIIYKPCIEKKFENVANFVTDSPTFYEKNRRFMPILLGNTINESLSLLHIIQPYTLYDYIQTNLEDGFKFDSEDLSKITQLVESFYSKDDIEDYEKQNHIFFSSDYKFVYPNLRVVKEGLKNNGTVFYYLFRYCGDRDYSKKKYNIQANTTTHADELGYMFDLRLSFINQTYISKEDQLMIDRLTKVWSNFTKYGDPTPRTSQLLPIKWKPVTEKTLYTMIFDSNISLIKRPFHARMSFWELFYDVNYKHKIGYRDVDTE